MSQPRVEQKSESLDCPFLREPCPQGPDVGAHCQLRVAQDFDPVAKFYEQEVIHCALCDKDFRVAEVQHIRTNVSTK